MTLAPNTVLVMASLAAGWLALFPIRERLGWTYHLAALPIGLLAWPVAFSVSTILGITPGPAGILAIAAVWAAAVAVAARQTGGRSSGRPSGPTVIAPWTFAFVAVAMTAVAEGISRLGVMVVTPDSWADYEGMAIFLADTGSVTPGIFSQRGLFIPAFHAAARVFGADITYAVYPVLSLLVLGYLALLVWRSAEGLATPVRSLLVTVMILVLATIPVWAYTALYLHSHMVSAAYLLLVFGSLWHAHDPRTADDSAPWLLLCALAASSFALARPDGIAYVIVPMVTVLACAARGGRTTRETMWFFGPLLATLWFVHGAAYLRLGMWVSPKLDGRLALAVLLVLSLVAVVPWALARGGRAGRWLATGVRLHAAAVALTAAALGVVAVLRPERTAEALGNMFVNLTQTGGWGPVWYALAAALIAAVVARMTFREPDLERLGWHDSLGLTIVHFFLFAMLVHAAQHTGRLYWGDSFNRVAFHALPLIFLYVGAAVASLLRPGTRRSRQTRSRVRAQAPR